MEFFKRMAGENLKPAFVYEVKSSVRLRCQVSSIQRAGFSEGRRGGQGGARPGLGSGRQGQARLGG